MELEIVKNDEMLPEAYVPPVVPASFFMQLTPRNQPIPIPDWMLKDGWRPNMEALSKPTPKDYRKVARNKEGMVMYRYAPISFFIKRANETWGAGNWGMEIVREEAGEPDAKGNFEYTAVIQFVAPGLFRPVIGVGSSTFYANNAQESTAKTRNAALTSALKSALKTGFGIGRDVEEDDPEVAQVVNGRLTAISTVFKRLVDTGKGDVAKELVRKYAPSALLESGELLPGSIDFEQLEPLQRGLQDLVIAGAMAKAQAEVAK